MFNSIYFFLQIIIIKKPQLRVNELVYVPSGRLNQLFVDVDAHYLPRQQVLSHNQGELAVVAPDVQHVFVCLKYFI